MKQIPDYILKHNGLEGDWDEMIFTGINPTATDVNFNFFDGLVSLQTNVPNTPIGYIPPPVLVGQTPTPLPAILTYPTINVVDSYSIGSASRNKTMKYDSVHNRMYMTYTNALNQSFVTWKDSVNNFYDISVALTGGAPFSNTIVDSSVSTTSNKLIMMSGFGRYFILSTVTNTLVAVFNDTSFGDFHRQIEWCSVNNSWYSTCVNGTIREIDAVTNAVIALFSTGGGKQPFGLSYKSVTNEMFVTYDASSEIASIDCNTNTLTIIILATITANPRVIIYNPITDLVTYGSNLNSGVRTFNATTLVFSATVINQTILHIGNYPTDNKFYFLPATGTSINIYDSNTLALVNSVNSTTAITSASDFCQIELYPPDNEMYYNVNVSQNPTLNGRIFLQPPVFYIVGSVEYNQTVRDFFNSPAWIRRIYFYSQTKENLYQVIQHIYKDANGIECNIPRIPSLSIGINQFQGWIAELDFKGDECVFGINQFFQDVLVKSGTELGMLLIYKQIEKIKLLGANTGMLDKTICDEYASCPNKLRKWSEKDLALNDYAVVTPFKQNMFAGQKEDAVKPFSFDMLKVYQIEDGCKNICDK